MYISDRKSYEKILVYHLGSLGDTLVALPGFQAVRDNFPSAHITVMTYDQTSKNVVLCREILDGSGLVDEYIHYRIDTSFFGTVLKLPRMSALLAMLRRRRFDALVYLLPIEAGNPRFQRDRQFFRLAGIRDIIGLTGFARKPPGSMKHPLPEVPHVSDQILGRLAVSGLVVPSARNSGRSLNVFGEQKAAVEALLRNEGSDGDRTWIAIGPGSKMPAKIWPKERFRSLVRRLIMEYDVWPVVFGGLEDAGIGQELVSQWGCGYVAAGKLGIRDALGALERCALYIGNDTGTLHMAASVGVKCIGIYSARDYPGLWYPYGHGHTVLRHATACEGCMKEVCIDNEMLCLMSIDVDEVYKAATTYLYRADGSTGYTNISKCRAETSKIGTVCLKS